MKALSSILVLLVAALHAAFLALEMFFWDHPLGRRIFAMTEEQSANSAILAANQGLYNGFLAAGLLWGLVARKRDVVIFFLLCVILAGAFGGATAKPTIWLTQAAPGAVALLFVLIAGPMRGRSAA
jgi:putative membrane protein